MVWAETHTSLSISASAVMRYGCIGLLLLAAPSLLQAQTTSDEVATKVASYGLRAIDPPVPAHDLTLPRMDGGSAALSDFQGRWVLLTFFATWCGPCRTEMPTLEAVHRRRGSALGESALGESALVAGGGDANQAITPGIVVLGISIDDNRSPLDAYLRQAGVTFPVLWDENGMAARAYQASSIPLSYLIDPRGQLVAVSRGARDWTTLIPLLDELSGRSVAGDSVYTANNADSVELPSTLTPPTADVRLATAKPTVGEPFVVEVDLQWAGNFEDYLPHPPSIALPEGMTQENVAAATSSRDGRSHVTYRLTLRADTAGSYALDPVELSYTPLRATAAAAEPQAEPGSSQRMATRVSGPTVEVRRATIAGMAPGTFAATVGGAVAAFGLAALGLVFWRRRAGSEALATAGVDGVELAAWQTQLETARRYRMQGDGRAALLALTELDAEAHGLSTSEIDAVRYGGRTPPPEEMDRLTRRAERWIEARRPDPDANKRTALIENTTKRAALKEGDAR